jgi:hypothetical protein
LDEVRIGADKMTKWIVSGLALFIGLISLIHLLTSFGEAWARPHRVGKIPASTLGCGVCHINPNGGGPRNSFGEDYAKIAISAGDKYTDELGARDSDGDGYTNDQEFSTGAHPGDAASKPSK